MPKASDLAAKLLKDAAIFFEKISDQNPDLAEQMRENASVYRQVSDMVESDPSQEFGEEADLHGRQEAAEFVRRPAWTSDLWGVSAGDRIPFSRALPWRRCTAEEVALWAARLTDERDEQRLVRLPDVRLLESATFWLCDTTFYGDEARLLHIAGPGADPRDGYFLEYVVRSGGGERLLVPLSRKAGPIHSVNQRAPLLIDGCELDYLIFFTHLVGDEGMFRVLQRNSLAHVRDVLSELGGEGPDVAAKLGPPEPRGVTPSGAVRYRVSMLYAGAIFNALVDVEPDGNVKMTDDDKLCDPIDALIDPLAKEA